MTMPGRLYVTVASTKVRKQCSCERCHREYFYDMTVYGSGSGKSELWLDNRGAQSQASASAKNELEREIERAVDVVACPSCGWLQTEMVALVRRRNAQRIFWWTLPLALLLPIVGMLGGGSPGAAALHGALVMVVGLGSALWVRLRFDPNESSDDGAEDQGPRTRASSEQSPAKVATRGQDVEEYKAQQAADPAIAKYRNRLRTVLLLASGGSERGIAAAIAIYRQQTEVDLDPSEARSEFDALIQGGDQTWQQLREMGENMSVATIGRFFWYALGCGIANGLPDVAGWNHLLAIGAALGMQRHEARSSVHSFVGGLKDLLPPHVIESLKDFLDAALQAKFPDSEQVTRM